MNTITLSTTNGLLTLTTEGDKIISAELPGLTMTSSYLENGDIVVGHIDAPCGTILPMSVEEINNLHLTGGKAYLYAEDLFAFTIRPSWWTVECDMAIEGEAPAYPMAEDVQANPLADIIGTIMGMLVIGDDDDTMTTEEKYKLLGWDEEE